MKTKTIYQYALGALIVIGFFALLYLLTQKPVPAENKDSLNLVIGSLLGAFSLIVGYFYGSSLGSSEKNEIIANQNNNKPA